MLNTRLLLAASWFRLGSSVESLAALYQGLWILPPQDEPSPIEQEESYIAHEPQLTNITFGIVRTLGMIGEWTAEIPIEESYIAHETHFADTTVGIVRILGAMGEWYIEPPPALIRETFPDFLYMDYVLDELI